MLAIPQLTRGQHNVLILLSDQHSKFHLGCYGDQLVRTPNLDKLADKGMRFENAYCPAPYCVPSRMSFMTARWPSQNRVWLNDHVLHSAIPTWAHGMGAVGYETALMRGLPRRDEDNVESGTGIDYLLP